MAEACIEAGASYCDLSDCRVFVNGIERLAARARAANVALLSGCSSVPSLSSAILDEQRHHFGDDHQAGTVAMALTLARKIF